jgi:hypothetical protein
MNELPNDSPRPEGRGIVLQGMDFMRVHTPDKQGCTGSKRPDAYTREREEGMDPPANQPARVSALLLERYRLGELDPGEKYRVEDFLRTNKDAARRLEELKVQDREIKDAYPLERALSGYRIKIRIFPLRRAFAILGASAAAVLLVLGLSLSGGQRDSGFTDRIKGGSELRVYLKPGDTSLDDNAVLHEGSTVQLAYTAGEGRYGVIFSIDGRRTVTLHYPYRVNGSTALNAGRRTALEEAYTLDDAPDCEIFFFIISDTPVNAAEILDRAKILAENPHTAQARGAGVFSGYEVKTVYLRKE